MRRSNSPGRPVSSACTGASKPSAAADFGTSCTWPSVIMMTPARRSGGIVGERLVEVGEEVRAGRCHRRRAATTVTHLTSRFGMLAELGLEVGADRGGLRRPAGERLAGAFVDHDDGDVGEALALLLAQRRIGERQQAARRGRAARSTRAARPAEQQHGRPAASGQRRPPPSSTGAGSIGAKSIDQFMRSASLPEPFEQRRDVHLIGLVVAGQRVHHDVDAGAERHLALRLAAGHDRDRAAGRWSSSAQAAARSFDVTMIELTPSDAARLPAR